MALAPALRRRPALEVEHLCLCGNPFGDEGLAALLEPPARHLQVLCRCAAAAEDGGLKKLRTLDLDETQRSPTPGTPPSPPRSTHSGALVPALEHLSSS